MNTKTAVCEDCNKTYRTQIGHCPGCHRSFVSWRAVAGHRDRKTRQCLSDQQLTDKGWVVDGDFMLSARDQRERERLRTRNPFGTGWGTGGTTASQPPAPYDYRREGATGDSAPAAGTGTSVGRRQ